jgi:hypothetical protein
MKKLVKCGVIAGVLLSVAPLAIQAIPPIPVFTCITACCHGGASTYTCSHNGALMTCGQWRQSYQCP